MRRSTDNLIYNILVHMNEQGLSYAEVDRMQIREQCEITGRFLRQIVQKQREPGLAKIDAIADLFKTESHLLLEPSDYRDEISKESRRVDGLLKNYLEATIDGKQYIDTAAELAPKSRKRQPNKSQQASSG